MEPIDYVKQIDQNGRVHFSALVHWPHARGPAHCLMQAVFLPGNQLKLFLAHLKTCPSYRGIFSDTEAVAKAAGRTLEEYFGDLSHLDVEWLFRYGQFGSYDPGAHTGTMRYFLTSDSDRKWHYKKYDAVRLTAEEEAQIIRLTHVPTVEEDLEKLPRLPPLDPREF